MDLQPTSAFSQPHTESTKVAAALDLVEELRSEISDLKSAYQTLNHQYQSAVDEKKTVESMHNKIIGEWKSQLNEKSKEFESLKGQIMTAKDVEMLRIKLAEEFEETKKKKWAVLQEDIARFSGLYYSLRQQYEELKMEMEKQTFECETIISETKQKSQDEVMRLRLELKKAKTAIYENPLENQRSRELTRENKELTVKCKELIQELDSVRAEKAALLIESEQNHCLLQRQLSEQTTFAKTLSSEKDGLNEKIERIQIEVQKYMSRQEELVQENARLSQELSKINSRYEEAAHRHRIDCSDIRLIHMKEKAQYEQERSQLMKGWERTKSELADATGQIQESKVSFETLEKKSMEQVRTIQEEEWSKNRILEAKKQEIERHLHETQVKYTEIINKLTTEKDEVEKEFNRLNSMFSDLQATHQKEIFAHQETMGKVADAEKLTLELRSKVCELEGKFEVELTTWRKTEKSLKDKIAESESFVSTAREEMAQLQDKWISEKTTVEMKSNEVQSLRLKLKDSQKLQDGLDTEIDLLKAEIEKTKKNSKHKSSILKSQLSELAHKFETIQKENDLLRSQNERRANDQQKRNSEFLNFLKGEGLALN